MSVQRSLKRPWSDPPLFDGTGGEIERRPGPSPPAMSHARFSFEMTSTPLTARQLPDLGALTIRSQRDHDVHVLALDGELDVASAARVESELRRIERASLPADAIVIDLRGLTFIDSTGLRLLIEATSRAETAAHRLRLVQPADHVFRVCVIAGIDTLLPFERAPAEADA